MNNKTKLLPICLNLVLFLLFCFHSAQANEGLWQDIQISARHNDHSPYNNSRELHLDETQMQRLLKQTQYAQKSAQLTLISLPLPNGTTVNVAPVKTNVLPPQLALKYPNIKTYKITSHSHNIIGGRLDFTPSGFHAMLQTNTGQVIYINPRQTSGKRRYYSYQKKDQHPTTPHQCELKKQSSQQSSPRDIHPAHYRTANRKETNAHQYRIAIAATGEYTQSQGGTVRSALSAIVTTLNRINSIYERDLGLHLLLAENNDEIIYTDTQSDPYSNGQSRRLLDENQQNLNTVIGSAHYDIGHVLGTSGGGLAIVSGLCSSRSKAKGASGLNDPQGDHFNVDFVAHEIGHQLGATHTFNSNQGLCSGSTRTSRTAFEPGSGSTIMAYTGICGSDNLQATTDAMFHIGSIDQIKNNLNYGVASTCGQHSENTNRAPAVKAGKDYTIPTHTPFMLKGTANDPENDTLSHTWQQIDSGSSSEEHNDRGNNALFRSYTPSASTSRTFPLLNSILSHQKIKGETLPTTERELNFKFSSQDGHNNTNGDTVKIHVKDTGSRFALDLPYTHYTIGETTALTWHVANTHQAPINCQTIDIALSQDGGQHFATLLASNVLNNGKASVYLPNTLSPSTTARFKISCSDNIFFAISYQNFAIGYETSDHSQSPSPEPHLINKKQPQQPLNNESKIGAGAFNLYLFCFCLLLILSSQCFRKNKLTTNTKGFNG